MAFYGYQAAPKDFSWIQAGAQAIGQLAKIPEALRLNQEVKENRLSNQQLQQALTTSLDGLTDEEVMKSGVGMNKATLLQVAQPGKNESAQEYAGRVTKIFGLLGPMTADKIKQKALAEKNQQISTAAQGAMFGGEGAKPLAQTMDDIAASGSFEAAIKKQLPAPTTENYESRVAATLGPDVTSKDLEQNPSYQIGLDTAGRLDTMEQAKREKGLVGKDAAETGLNLLGAGIDKPTDVTKTVLENQMKQTPTSTEALQRDRLDLDKAKLDFQKLVAGGKSFEDGRKPYYSDRRQVREQILKLESALDKAKHPKDPLGNPTAADPSVIADLEEAIDQQKDEFTKINNMIKWSHIIQNKGKHLEFPGEGTEPVAIGEDSGASTLSAPAPSPSGFNKNDSEVRIQQGVARLRAKGYDEAKIQEWAKAKRQEYGLI